MTDAPPEKILLIQFRQLGDVLLTSPAARVLKDNYPGAKVDFLTQPPCGQALAGNPWIDEVLLYDKSAPLRWLAEVRRRRYDLVVDFMSTSRSALVSFFSGARLRAGPAYTSSSWAYNRKLRRAPGQSDYTSFFKAELLGQLGLEKIGRYLPQFSPSPADGAWAAEQAAALGLAGSPFVAFSPASRRITRQWPAEHFAALARRLAEEKGLPSLFFWGPGEKELCVRIAALSGTPLARPAPETATVGRLAAMFRLSRLLVSNCNGAKHVAQAAGVSTVGIYGASRPENWTPPGDPRHQFIRNEALDCIGCGSHECAVGIRCLRDLSPEAVFAKLSPMLDKAA